MAHWSDDGVTPDWRDEDPTYSQPTPADEGFEYEHYRQRWALGVDQVPDDDT